METDLHIITETVLVQCHAYGNDGLWRSETLRILLQLKSVKKRGS